MSLGFHPQKKKFKKRKRGEKNTLHTLASAFLKERKMSAVAVTPGAVAKIRESKIVTDELNVQVRSRLRSPSFSVRLSIRVEGTLSFFFPKTFLDSLSLFLLGFPNKSSSVCRFENFLSRVSKKMKHKTDRNPLRGFFFFFTNTPLPLDHDRFSSLMALTMRFGAFSF